ncbi:MAG: 16S rRNA (cytosine(1402)-N(4))-methyltransferase RsmH [Pseudomonadota bacterium]
MYTHAPVMRDQVLAGLALRPDGRYVDATFGRGGHSAAILSALGEDGQLLALDRDDAAVAVARQHFGGDERFTIRHAAFAALRDIVADESLSGAVDGLLFDFGVSSPQLDDAERGFSFLRDGPLDMRMDQAQTVTAANYLSTVDEPALRRDLAAYGEERLAGRIASAIIRARQQRPIERTLQLAEIVEQAVPARVRNQSRKHPATKTFQAIRIRVNAELEQITAALEAVLDVLAVGGRVCFLTFHSLEDRPVKQYLRQYAEGDPVWRGLPDAPEWALPRLKIVGKDAVANADELEENPRARSARLRIGERVR